MELQSLSVWRARRWLAAPGAPKAVSASVLARALGFQDDQALGLAKELCAAGLIAPAMADPALHVNLSCAPKGALTDVMLAWRPMARLSLHTVLGAAGIHNNPSVMAFGVEPESALSDQSCAKASSLGEMRLFALPAKFFEDGVGWDCEIGGRRAFEPEKALLDWIWLGSRQGG